MEKFCNFFVISIVVVAIVGADYCDDKLCSTGQHIACRHNGVSPLVIILITTITTYKIDKIINGSRVGYALVGIYSRNGDEA